MNEKIFFFHIPKTGGNWVMRVLESVGLKGTTIIPFNNIPFTSFMGTPHVTPNHVDPKTLENKFIFCFV